MAVASASRPTLAGRANVKGSTRVAPAVLERRSSCDVGSRSKGERKMERMLVVVFDAEDKADKAAKELEQLKDLSVIALNADAIVAKDLQGDTTVAHPHTLDPQAAMGGT